MELRIFFSIFLTVLFAELGDKTQLATLLFATNKDISKWLIFGGAAAALITASAAAVLFGGLVGKYMNPKYLSWIAGAGFILIGLWCIVKA